MAAILLAQRLALKENLPEQREGLGLHLPVYCPAQKSPLLLQVEQAIPILQRHTDQFHPHGRHQAPFQCRAAKGLQGVAREVGGAINLCTGEKMISESRGGNWEDGTLGERMAGKGLEESKGVAGKGLEEM